MRSRVARILLTALPPLVLLVCALPQRITSMSDGPIDSAVRDLTRFLNNPETQWMAFLCAGVYFAISISLYRDVKRESANGHSYATLWLAVTMLIAACSYAVNYSAASTNTAALTFVASVALGATFGVWDRYLLRSGYGMMATRLLIIATVVVLSLVALRQQDWGTTMHYRGQSRWGGVWGHPNTYGLFMGLGVVLTSGLLLRQWRKSTTATTDSDSQEGGSSRPSSTLTRSLILASLAMIVMGVGLVMSYSRGALLATALGLAYLVWHLYGTKIAARCRRSTILLALAGVFALGVLFYWNFQHTDQRIVRRIFSVANPNDFSWRQRLSAYEGGLQMIAEKPLVGFGWDQPEKVFDQFFRSFKQSEAAAITLNDFLTLGMSLGLPALLGLALFLRASLKESLRKGGEPYKGLPTRVSDLKLICNAGVIVFLVGFWFHSGLFEFGVASVFWCFVTLRPTGQKAEKPFFDWNRVWQAPVERWRAWPVAARRPVGAALIFALIVLIIPALQVLYAGFFNPSVTVPRLGRDMTSTVFNLRLEPGRQSWKSLPDVSSNFVTSVWISEDNRFFSHSGFDWNQIWKAREEAKRLGKPIRGASTITQQCARSLFLWQGRSWIRKGCEAYYTIWMELLLPKKRIFELYVNVIEFGDGVFGIEAASQVYYRVPAKELSAEQAAMLVAIMPNPRQWNPLRPNERVLQRQTTILERARHAQCPLNFFVSQ